MTTQPTESHHVRRVKALTCDLPAPVFAAKARQHCRFAIANTAVGAWLEVALERLESEHQNACGKQH